MVGVCVIAVFVAAILCGTMRTGGPADVSDCHKSNAAPESRTTGSICLSLQSYELTPKRPDVSAHLSFSVLFPDRNLQDDWRTAAERHQKTASFKSKQRLHLSLSVLIV
jgi:hypothetical protein